MSAQHHTQAPAGRVQLDSFGARVLAPRADAGVRALVVASRFNEAIVERLVEGALAALADLGVRGDAVRLAWVPGAWELPQAVSGLIAAEPADAVIALGCVIRGETAHFDVIVDESARGLMSVSLRLGLPVANGVLACENEQQAWDRAGGAAGNKGAEAAQAAVHMARLIKAAGEQR
jgi:6,7-dimethyl-8-ribityllumazine synthase